METLFLSSSSFHQSCLNELARSLTLVNKEKDEKESLLLSHCPPLKNGRIDSPLTGRWLDAVVSIGLYSLQDKTGCSKNIFNYLLQLLECLPSSSWVQYSKPKEGLIVQDFYYKLSLILLSIAETFPEYHDQVIGSLFDLLHLLTDKFLNCSSPSTSKERCVFELVPSLIGLCHSLSQSQSQRRVSLNTLFDQNETNNDGDGKELVTVHNFKSTPGQLGRLLNDVQKVFTGNDYFEMVDLYLIELLPNVKFYPLTVISHPLKCALLSAFKNIAVNSSEGVHLDKDFHSSVYSLTDGILKTNTKLLQGRRGEGDRMNEWLIYVVKVMCSATDLLVWSVTDKDDGDALFLHLCQLLAVNAGNLNVVASPLRVTILEGLSSLAVQFPPLINGTLARLMDFLLSILFIHSYSDALSLGALPDSLSPDTLKLLQEPFPISFTSIYISRADSFLLILDTLSHSVCRLLRADGTGTCSTSFIGSLGNKLYTADTKEASSLHTAECIIKLLGKVGVSLGSEKDVVTRIMSVFRQRLFHPASSLDGVIITELGKMAAELGDSEIIDVLSQLMSEALGMVTTPYPTSSTSSTSVNKIPVKNQRSDSHDKSHIFRPVMDALVYVATHLKDKEQQLDFLQRVLYSFVHQGIQGKRVSERKETYNQLKASSTSFSLGLLLPVLATLCHKIDPILSPTPRILKLFRDFWLYCLLLGFSDSEKGVFPPTWYNDVSDIAIKSPLLIVSGAEKYLDKELELNHPLKKGDITVGELQEARLALQEVLGRSVELDKLVHRLTFAQCMYLQSISRLETVRLEKDSRCFPYIFQYLDDEGLQKELWVAMESIAQKIFDRLLVLLSDKKSTSEREEELESHAVLLLFKFNHIRGRIKRLADNFLSRLVDKFPHLLWSKTLLHTSLNLLQELSVHVSPLDTDCMVTEIKLPGLSHTILLPDDMKKRESTVVNFAKRCGEIIKLAMEWAPDQTKSILKNYICIEGHVLQGLLHHSGVSLATHQLTNHLQYNTNSEHIPMSVIGNYPDCLKDTRSQCLSSVVMQSQFLGGIRIATDLFNNDNDKGYSSLTVSANTQLMSAIDSTDLKLITTALYNATALLISCKGKHQRTLLHSIVHLPVKTFNNEVITIATHCWQWLIVACPHLEYKFMKEFSSAWQWTITSNKGMFSEHSKTLKPQDVQPHLVLINFLSQRFEVFHTSSSSLVALLNTLLHQSLTLGVGPRSDLQSQQYISHSIAACSARFQFLTLGVQLIKRQLIASSLDRTFLREKIYNAALDFFSYQPSWIVGDIKTLRQTMDSLIKFWQAVKEIRNVVMINNNNNTGFDGMPVSALPRNSSFWQALDSPSVQGSWLNTYSSNRGSNARTQSAAPSSTGHRSTAVKSKVLLKRRNLILAILRHEVERLSAWLNPMSIPELLVPGEDSLQTWINPTQTDRNWRNTVTMAFQTSPHLAFYVYYRFRNNEGVVREFNRLIQTNPVSFVDIPEAALNLATKELIEKDSKELYHLLYWRGIPPAMALMYFTKPYSTHPITGQFANKAMGSFKPADIVQYIPQVVQALRYDKLGFAKDYILSAARSSQLLAHQFLWNIQANTYTDEEGENKDPEIGTLLEELSEEILHNLSGVALKFYEREFTFFKKVTDISGIIRPFPKPERKKECLKALQEVVLEPGVYLPSNPDAIVIDIDYNSGTPMQSAAKAPFLAKFKVQPCGITEMEALNTQKDDALMADLQKFAASDQSVWQGCIFKVGDDVRQDMLALQIINFCKDVFEDIGLQLYLVPYRVVATAPGCGVIEVVPDSKSRDQLGKQTQVSLKDYFQSIYGEEDSFPYQEARSNFIRSMAAYSLITYLLQIKDRHNGNIMLDKWGHIIHIDFGFLFESSPGGNLGFEPDLKLTEEMLDIMGGKKSDSYRWFLDLCVRGYLAVRPYQEQVVAMVTLMLDTGFPCFRGNTIEELRARFRYNLSEKEAAKAMVEVVESSCLNFRTLSYDLIQDVQQNIYYHKKN